MPGAEKIKPFIVMDVLEKACARECRGEDILHLEVGEPDVDTPDCVKAAAVQAVATFEPYRVSGEIFHGLVYAGKAHAILEHCYWTKL